MSTRSRPSSVTTVLGEVAFAAVRGGKTLTDLAQPSDAYPNQITKWRSQLFEGAAEVFGSTSDATTASAKRKYRLAQVCHSWRFSRATVYWHRQADTRPSPPCRHPSPSGSMPDTALAERIAALAAQFYSRAPLKMGGLSGGFQFSGSPTASPQNTWCAVPRSVRPRPRR